MNCKPVKRFRAPAYPTRLQAMSDHRLLKNNLPPSWKRNPEVAGAFAVFLAANLVGCSGDQGTSLSPPAAMVAPVFQHGEGRGVTGCVMVSPPVFLSEEEAIQVIREEMAEAGLDMSLTDVEVPEVEVYRQQAYTRTVLGRDIHSIARIPGTERPLQFDLKDPNRNIAVEFVSTQDYFYLGGVEYGLSIQGFDLVGSATRLAEKVSRSESNTRVGVFYDPVSEVVPDEDPGETREERMKSWEEAHEAAIAESREQLRMQVGEFIDWLKAQGAI